ncbi:MAG: glycosyltransferase family 39 protein, partial [Planctomycetota bacterium]
MRRIVAGAFIGGLALRTLVAGFNGVISHDAACYYLPGARALLEHGLGHWEGMTIAAPPLFPTLVAILGRAIADLEIAALSIAVLAGAAIVFPVLGLGRLLCPGADRAHAFSVLLAAVQPLSLRFGGDARADSLYALLFACALWAGLRVLWRPSARGGALFGLLVGLGYLLRPEALGLLPLLAVAASAELWRRRREAGPTLRRIAGAALATLLLLAPALAWNVLFVHDRVGVWTLSPQAGMLLDYGKGGADPFTRLNRSRTMT